ncbi:undecaprenyl-diphosphate phosphatase [Candidatus Woesearchaeota archaeon]|jgi:undecaprenyl-diphosphatase|nr:undecaprenyl-diphosphate phosphatase [Candidatus Woesearchaeota archaeon]MBT4114341.1 undecaprenyl-diphosphate phosphatase [Candidatus Woesearchaeota archaeon]MBT4248630.1 undecaprenyl-diphosphate phosphatase [Candidatus Woesearchaeota archaeon]
MVSVIQAIFLGILQGLTEWLPVSSSGHLVIFQQLFEINVPIFFDIMLHVGTAIVVVAFMRKEFIAMFKAFIKLDFKSKYGRWLLFLIIGSVITGFIGFFGHDFFVGLFNQVRYVAAALFVTGVFLLVIERFEKEGELKIKHSALMGLVQGIAIIPGISRSGATVGSALIAGANREDAAKFSFMLAVPAIIGAAVFEYVSSDMVVSLTLPLLAGTLAAMIVGYLSLKLFLKIILSKRLWMFGVYCIAVSLILITII